mgnify:CR=1 FL=1
MSPTPRRNDDEPVVSSLVSTPRTRARLNASGRYVRVLKPGEFGELVYVRTTCSWRGEPFIVLAEADNWLRLEYTGGRAPVARDLGLEEFDFGVYQGWAPAQEVNDLYEHRV